MTGRDKETREREAEVREMVLSAVLGLAGSVVDKAETAGLQQAHLVEELDAAGAVWTVRAIFYRETMCVQIAATAKPKESSLPEGFDGAAVEIPGVGVGRFVSPEELMRLFNTGEGQPSLSFVVPVAWVLLARWGGA